MGINTYIPKTETSPNKRAPFREDQVENSTGGFVFEAGIWSKLDRLLILGAEGNTYYAKEQEVVEAACKNALKCIATDPIRVIKRVVEVSDQNLAPKNTPAIFVLALTIAKSPAPEVRTAGYDALPKVCRIGTHLFQFLKVADSFGLTGSGMQRAVARWYNEKAPDQLAYQVTKYAQREGWTHRDVLRKFHVKPEGDAHNAIYRRLVGADDGIREVERKDGSGHRYPPVESDLLPDLFGHIEEVKKAETAKEVAKLITEHRLVREVIPGDWLSKTEVWEALYPTMPLGALIRNLGKLTQVGILEFGSEQVTDAIARLTDEKALAKARIHPAVILNALQVYGQGQGFRGKLSWTPVPQIKDALDDAFERSFKFIEPANKRFYLAIDVSSSMTWDSCAGLEALKPNIGAAAMAMATARTEPVTYIAGFSQRLVELPITRKTSLADAVKITQGRSFGSTNPSAPMLDALEKGMKIDAFVVYTDSETNCGRMHPFQALQKYRKETGIDARLIVCAMVGNRFSIADPNDPGMLDVVGFDASAPKIISNFAAAKL